MLAEMYGLAGRPAAGLPVLDQAEAAAERTGVRWYDAEIHRRLDLDPTIQVH